jgi:Glycosyltransferase family 87
MGSAHDLFLESAAVTQPLSEPPVEAKSRPAFSWLPYVLVMIPIAIGMGTPAWRRSSIEWTTVFVEAARRLLKADNVFWANGYVYPPFSALAAVPFTWLSDKASQLAFYLISLACLCLMTRLAWDLSGARTDRSSSKSAKAEHATFLLACAIAIKFAFNALSHLQTDLIVDALLMLGLLALTQLRFVVAGTCWGLSAAFKGPPLLMVVYLLWRKKFGAAIVMLAVAIGVNLLPNLVSRPPGGGLWLTQWINSYAKPFGKDDMPGNWYNNIINNQSIAGAVNRWLATTPTKSKARVDATPRKAGVDATPLKPAPSPLMLKGVTMGANLAVFAFTLATLFTGSGKSKPAHGIARQVLECSMFFILTLLLSPMTSRTHFGILILPAFCLCRDAIYSGDKFSWTLVMLALVFSVSSFNIASDKTFVEMSFWLGSVMFCAVFLLIGCGHLILRGAPAAGAGKAMARPGAPSPA